jgi:polyhydroxyalkanoate synthesis regulator phasin
MCGCCSPSEADILREEISELEEQVDCVKREIAYREKCYPYFVKQGKLSQEEADIQLPLMRNVLVTIEYVLSGAKDDLEELEG